MHSIIKKITYLILSPLFIFGSIIYGFIIGLYGGVHSWAERFKSQLLTQKKQYQLFPNHVSKKNIKIDIKNIKNETEKERAQYQYNLGKKKPLNYFTECLETIIINSVIWLPISILRGIIIGPYNASTNILKFINKKLY